MRCLVGVCRGHGVQTFVRRCPDGNARVFRSTLCGDIDPHPTQPTSPKESRTKSPESPPRPSARGTAVPTLPDRKDKAADWDQRARRRTRGCMRRRAIVGMVRLCDGPTMGRWVAGCTRHINQRSYGHPLKTGMEILGMFFPRLLCWCAVVAGYNHHTAELVFFAGRRSLGTIRARVAPTIPFSEVRRPGPLLTAVLRAQDAARGPPLSRETWIW